MKDHYPAWVYKEARVDTRELPLLSIVTIRDIEYDRPFKSSYVLFPSTEKVASAISSLRERLMATKKSELDDYWAAK